MLGCLYELRYCLDYLPPWEIIMIQECKMKKREAVMVVYFRWPTSHRRTHSYLPLLFKEEA